MTPTMASLSKMLDPSLPGASIDKFQSDLERLVIGQSEAIKQVVELFRIWSAGLSDARRPIGNLLFLGPTGTGKTRLVEAVAASILGDERAVLKIDCAEFQHSHEIAKLIGCFVPDTQILMSDGTTKAIKDVAIGDRVICGDGVVRPVLDTHRYHHHGKVAKMHIASHSEPLIGTLEHKIWAIKNPAGDGKRNRNLDAMYRPENLRAIELQKLFKKDAVVYPRWKGQVIEPPVLDLADWAKKLIDPVITDEWVSPRGYRATPVKRYIQVDEDFCRLAGYYVAEGGISRDADGSTGVSFTMGVPHKQDALDDVNGLVTRIFGINCSVCAEDRTEHGSIRLYFHSHVGCQVFEDLFGGGTFTKRVPEWFLSLPENLLWNFIDAACMGDGGRTEPRRFDYSTCSKDLHSQFNTILRYRLGVTTQMQKHESTRANWATRYRTYVAGAQIDRVLKNLPMFGPIVAAAGDDRKRANEGIQRGSFVDSEFIYFQVDSVELVDYDGAVHDISVSENPDEQWYVAENARVSNSPAGYLGHRETQPLLSPEAVNRYQTDSIKISFVLFDEIEKASNALWNLLLGILDKATLTLGDTRKVDFSKAMIFMTSNLGAADMAKIISPGLGFAPVVNTGTEERIKSAGISGARRNFTPEFMNRLDKVVVFNSLSTNDMDRILGLELGAVQQRILNSASTPPFVIKTLPEARKFILGNGIDDKYGARYLKRAIERLLVNPLANLIASGQIKGGDLVEAGVDSAGEKLTFCRKAENIQAHTMVLENKIAAGNGTGGNLSGNGQQVPAQAAPADPERRVIPFVKRGSPQRSARKRIGIKT